MQKKVMLVDSFDNGSSYWRVACDCCDSDHDAVLWFEYDKDLDMMVLTVSTEIGFIDGPLLRHRWFYILKNLLKRIRVAAQILFLGHYRETGEVVLVRDGIEGMIHALSEGKRLLDEAKKAS